MSGESIYTYLNINKKCSIFKAMLSSQDTKIRRQVCTPILKNPRKKGSKERFQDTIHIGEKNL